MNINLNLCLVVRPKDSNADPVRLINQKSIHPHIIMIASSKSNSQGENAALEQMDFNDNERQTEKYETRFYIDIKKHLLSVSSSNQTMHI